MRVVSPSLTALLVVQLLLTACPPAAPPAEGEGDDVGEGEGDDVGEGEGDDVGEGEGDDVGEGEGEGDVPVDGFGVISGDCGVLDDELSSADPFFFDNAIDFGSDGYDDPAERDQLTDGGARMAATPNAGGSSLFSEVFAYEVLARCEGALLEQTETEVQYVTATSKKTDMVISIDGERYGVSVVRSFVFPPGTPLSLAEASDRLQGKLDDILVSSANVVPEQAWDKQLLAVIAPEPEHVATLLEAWEGLDAATKADTIIYVTVSNGDDDFLY